MTTTVRWRKSLEQTHQEWRLHHQPPQREPLVSWEWFPEWGHLMACLGKSIFWPWFWILSHDFTVQGCLECGCGWTIACNLQWSAHGTKWPASEAALSFGRWRKINFSSLWRVSDLNTKETSNASMVIFHAERQTKSLRLSPLRQPRQELCTHLRIFHW